MSKQSARTFDCVQSMRKARDKLSAELAGKTYDEMLRWLRSRRYADPVLQRLADKAAQQADAAARPSVGR